MIKRTIFTLLLIFAFIAKSLASGHELSVGQIKPGMTIGDMKALIGEANSDIQQDDFITHIFKYDELDIGFSDAYIQWIYSKNKEYCTEQGLCPGDSISKMESIYTHAKQTEDSVYEFHNISYSLCWYRIHSSESVIAAVEIKCAP